MKSILVRDKKTKEKVLFVEMLKDGSVDMEIRDDIKDRVDVIVKCQDGSKIRWVEEIKK